jgi:hypothetical protein
VFYHKILLICLSIFSICFGQTSTPEHEAYIKELNQDASIDSLYQYYVTVPEESDLYYEALEFRNLYNWATGNVEQLKKDIPEILHYNKTLNELEYANFLELQYLPETEWNFYLEIAEKLVKYFENSPREYKEVFNVKVVLDILTMNEDSLKKDLHKLEQYYGKNSDFYFNTQLHYGNILVNNKKYNEAFDHFINNWNETKNPKILQSIVMLHNYLEAYNESIKYEADIILSEDAYLYFELGKAFLKLQKIDKAEHYFGLLTNQLELTNYFPYNKFNQEEYVFNLSGSDFELLGDFYRDIDKNLSCKFYNLSRLILVDLNDLYFIEEPEKSQLIESISEIETKLKSCKIINKSLELKRY